MELVVCWSGTKERKGHARPLSGYLGSSSLHGLMPDTRVGDVATVYQAAQAVSAAPEPSPEEVRAHLWRGHSMKSISELFKIPVRRVRTLSEKQA